MIEIDGFKIDCELSIDIQKDSTITSEPVEGRENVSDNIILMPYTAMLTAIVSDSPNAVVAPFRSEDSLPTDEIYAKLDLLWRSKKLFTVTSQSYPPMIDVVLKSFRAPRTALTGNSYQFTAIFKHIVLSEVLDVDGITLVELPRHKRRKKKGSKASTKVEALTPDSLIGLTGSATNVAEGPRKSVLLQGAESDTVGKGVSWGIDKMVHY